MSANPQVTSAESAVILMTDHSSESVPMFGRWWFPVAFGMAILLTLPAIVFFAMDLFGYGGEVNTWLEARLKLSYHSPLANWANIVLMILPVVLLLLYLLKLRRKPQMVASTFLWKKSIEDLHVNSLLQWLRRNVLLLLQLLVIACGLYAVLAPQLHGSKTSGKYFIIMVDNSASMSATDVAPNRLEWAKAEALKEIDVASDSDIGMVIVFNSTAEIRQSYTGNKSLLRKAVEEIRPTMLPTQIDEALSLAASLANPMRSTEDAAVRPENPEPGKERTYAAIEGLLADIHLYSDGRFADQPTFALANLQLNFHAPETKERGNANNIGITRFDAIRDETTPTKIQAFVTLMNFRNAPAKVGLELDLMAGNQRVLDVRRKDLVLPPRVYQEPAAGDPDPAKQTKDVPGEAVVKFDLGNVEENADITLRVRLVGTKDAFTADDQAWVVLSQIRKAQVLIVGPGNPLLKNFFDSKATRTICDVAEITPAQMADSKSYGIPVQEGRFDLVIFDRCGPAREEDMPRANTLFIGQPPPPWHLEGADDAYKVEKVTFPQIRGWSDQDPVMRGLRGWYELEVAEAHRYKNLPPKTPRLLEGDKDLLLLFPLSRQTHKDLVLAFPLSTNDEKWNTRWFLKPVFPLFLWNVVRTLGNVRDNATEESVTPGNPVRLQPPGDVTEISIASPDGASVDLKRGSRNDFQFGQANELGVYGATWKKESHRFAVNLFDPNESHIEPRPSVRIGDVEVQAGVQREKLRELWRWPVLAALVVLLLEWWIYNRRVHV